MFIHRRSRALFASCAMALAWAVAACGDTSVETSGGAAHWSLPAEGFEVVAVEPDAEIVADAAGRKRMKQTGLPWKVRHEASGIELLLCPPGEFLMGRRRRNSTEAIRSASIDARSVSRSTSAGRK